MSEETPLQRLTAATEAVTGVYDCLAQCARANGQTHLAEEIQRERSRIGGGLRVAIVGAFSSGKSTFVNALIGRKVLPTKVEPTTATVTEVHNGPSRTATVQLKTEEEIRRERDHARKRQGELQQQERREPHEDEELRSLAAVADLKPEFQFPGGLPQAFHLDRDADLKAVEQFLAEGEGSLAPYTERVTIEVPMDARAVPARAIIIDTPGSNSLSRVHRNATWRTLVEADCVVFLMTARAPFSAHDRELLHEIRAVRQQHGLEHDRFLFVANAIDDVEESERAGVKAYLTERIVAEGIEQPQVQTASALVAWLAQRHTAGETLSKRERRLLEDESDDQAERGWEASGIKDVMDTLWRTAGREAAINLYGEAVERAHGRSGFLKDEVDDQLKKVAESEEKVRGAAQEAERFLAGKRRHRGQIEQSGRQLAMKSLRGLDDLTELRQTLEAIVDQHSKEQNLADRLEARVRQWLNGRLGEVQNRVATAGELILGEVVRSLDLDESSASLASLPRTPTLAFDIRFDLPKLVDPREEGVAAPTSAGAILGGIIGALAGGPWGALLGAVLGGGLFNSGAAKVLKDKWNELLKRRKGEVDQYVRKLQPALAGYLKQVEDQLVEWGLDHFEGRLNDIRARYELRVKLAREAANNTPAVRARLEGHLQQLDHCRSLLDDARQKVAQLSSQA